MENQSVALLVSEQPEGTAAIQDAIARTGSVRVQTLEKLSTSIARLAGGGVSAILFDLAASRGQDALEGVLRLHSAAPEVPLIVLSDTATEAVALQALHNGAVASLDKNGSEVELRSKLEALLARIHQSKEAKPGVFETRGATVIAFAGVKGGVGCSTVALNVATILSRRHRVILAEVRSHLSFLRYYLRPQRAVRGIAPLLASRTAAESSLEAESNLWASRSAPNLRILFGPQATQECRAIDPQIAKALIRTLAKGADYVIVDLPSSLTDAGKAIAADCDLMALVVERDPLCLEYAKSTLQAIHAANASPNDLGTVVVNRAALACPMALSDIELALGASILGVVPPAVDLCVSAEKAHAPVVTFDPESLMSRSLMNLADRVDIRLPQ